MDIKSAAIGGGSVALGQLIALIFQARRNKP